MGAWRQQARELLIMEVIVILLSMTVEGGKEYHKVIGRLAWIQCRPASLVSKASRRLNFREAKPDGGGNFSKGGIRVV